MQKIVSRELDSIVKAYASEATLVVDVDIAAVANDQYDPRTGARGIPGYFATTLEPKIVNAILDNTSGNKVELRVMYDVESTDIVVEKKS
jgi:ATP-dependent Clp protease ATP-binding subunit ClpA